MIFYPDGLSTIGYNGFEGYSFWNNFISDLGMINTFGGIPKPVSSIFLLIGIIILAIGGSLFYIISHVIFREGNETITKLSAIASIFGIFGCLFSLGVPLFPKDTELVLHEIFSVLFFLFCFIAVLIFNRIIFLTEELSNKNTILGYIFIICGLIYVIVPKVIFPQFDDETQFIFKPTSQKIAVISLLVALLNYIYMIGSFKSK